MAGSHQISNPWKEGPWEETINKIFTEMPGREKSFVLMANPGHSKTWSPINLLTQNSHLSQLIKNARHLWGPTTTQDLGTCPFLVQNSKFPWFPRFGALKIAQPWVCFPEATGRICSLGAPGQFLGGKRLIQGLRCDWSPPYKLSDLGDPATSSFTFLKITNQPILIHSVCPWFKLSPTSVLMALLPGRGHVGQRLTSNS